MFGTVKTDPITKITTHAGEHVGERATGLCGIGGLTLRSELQAGVIPHALSFSPEAYSVKKGYPVWPGLQSDGASTNANAPREGQRLALPIDTVIDKTWPPILKMLPLNSGRLK